MPALARAGASNSLCLLLSCAARPLLQLSMGAWLVHSAPAPPAVCCCACRLCPFQVKETTRAVTFLHNELFFAAAQKKYVYIYDKRGLEVHCLREHLQPTQLEFLPHHFLLASVGEPGATRLLPLAARPAAGLPGSGPAGLAATQAGAAGL